MLKLKSRRYWPKITLDIFFAQVARVHHSWSHWINDHQRTSRKVVIEQRLNYVNALKSDVPLQQKKMILLLLLLWVKEKEGRKKGGANGKFFSDRNLWCTTVSFSVQVLWVCVTKRERERVFVNVCMGERMVK